MLKLCTCAAAVALLALTPAAPAQTWTGVNADENWSDAGDWTPATVPNSATAAATFPTLGAFIPYIVNLPSSMQAQSLTFSNTSGNYSITGSAISSLQSITVGSGVTTSNTISAPLSFVGGSTPLTITNNAALGSTPTLVLGAISTPDASITQGSNAINVTGTGFTSITGNVTGSGLGTLTKSGTGQLNLTGTNNFGGGPGNTGVALNGGTLAINGEGAFGASGLPLVLNVNSTTAGGLVFLNGGVTITRQVKLSSSTRIICNGTDTNTINFVSAPGGSATLVKDGTGTLILPATGGNTQTADTINGGTLAIYGDGSLGVAGGPVTFNGGTLEFVIGVTLSSQRSVVLNGSGGTIQVDASQAGNVNASISGSGGLTKTGAGNLALQGQNTFTGGLSVQQGTLSLGSPLPTGEALTLGGGTNSGTIDLLSHSVQVSSLVTSGTGTANTITNSNTTATLTVGNSSAQSFGGLISGNIVLTENGSATLTLTNATNTYSGGTNLNGGTLAVAADGSLGASSVGLTFGGGTLEATATFSSARGISLNTGGGTFSVDSGATLTLSGVVAGAAGLTKSGSGTLVLSNTNTYAGATTISAGTLAVAADGALGTSNGLTLGGGTLEATATFSSARAVSITGNSAVSVDSGATLTLSGGLSGTGGLTKAGPGTLILSADNTSYTGNVTISSGVIQMGNANALAGSTVILSINNGLSFGTLTAAPLGGLSGGGSLSLGSTNLTVGGNNASTAYSGVLSGSGSLTKNGTGTLTLSGNDSAYAGGVTINSGTIRIGNTVALSGSTVTINVNNGLDLGGFGGQTLGALAGTGNLTLGSTNLTVGGDNASTTYSGVLSGSGVFTKSGTGTLTLSNTANTSSGGMRVTGGVLSIAADGALGGASAGLTLNGGTLQFTGTGTVTALGASRQVSIGTSGGTIDTSGLGAVDGNVVTIASVISGIGPLTLNAHGDTSDTGNGSSSELILSGTNTFTGTVTINSGLVDAASSFGAAANTIAINGGGLVETFNTSTLTRNIALAGSGDRIVRVYAGGILTLGGVISGTGSLRETDSGTLVLTGANTYTGGTTIADGTLQVGAGGTAGVLPGNVTDNAALVFNRSDAVTYGGTMSGTGTVTQAGSGTLTLTGAGSSIGVLNVAAGSVTVGGASLTLTDANNPLYVGSGSAATLTVSGGAVVTLSNAGAVIDGPAGTAALVTGTGSQLQTATDLYLGKFGSGGLTVQNGGTVSVGRTLVVGGFTGGAGTVLVQSGGMVTSYFTNVAAESGSTGSITVTGAGSTFTATGSVFTLGGTTNGPGGTGMLTVANGGAVTAVGLTVLTSASSIIVNGGTLTTGGLGMVNGSTPAILLSDPASGPALTIGTDNSSSSWTSSIADAGGGPGTVNKVGTGTLTLTSHLTNTGGYIASAGTIEFSGAVVQPGIGSLTAAAGATIQYDTGARVFGGFLYGPGTHVVTGGTAFTGTTASNSALISVTGAGSFTSFTNGGTLNIAAGLASPVTFSGFTNQGSGAITVGQNSQLNVADFQSYGTLTLNPGTFNGTTGNFTQLTNTGSSDMFFNGGSRTFLSTPQQAANGNAGLDLHGFDAIVAGGLFVNNGYVVDSTNTGHRIVADFGAVVKGAGFYQPLPRTINGGTYSVGNSPGIGTTGDIVLGGPNDPNQGLSNYTWQINNAGPSSAFPAATGTAGPSPNAAKQVSGWGVLSAVILTSPVATTGDFQWDATPGDKLTIHLDTLLAPDDVNGNSIAGGGYGASGDNTAGLMSDFDPANSYTWKLFTYAGIYTGPTDTATLDASTSFDDSGFLNPHAGRFDLVLNQSSREMDLVFTPTAVPEPGTLLLTAGAGLGMLTWRRRRSCRLRQQ